MFSALEVGEDVNSSPTSKIKGGRRVCFTRFLFWPGLLSNARVHGGQDEAAAEIADSPCFMGGLVLQLPTLTRAILGHVIALKNNVLEIPGGSVKTVRIAFRNHPVLGAESCRVGGLGWL